MAPLGIASCAHQLSAGQWFFVERRLALRLPLATYDGRSPFASVQHRSLVPTASFPYRILFVDDEPLLRQVAQVTLEAKGYEVLCAEDGFGGLLALKRSLPDVIISDLRMPNMNGLEFLSVVRRRFPSIPVIVISGEFSGLNVPESVLADAFFPKGGFRPEDLFARIEQFLVELPTRPRLGKPPKAAVWVKNSGDMVAVTCTDCLRTFPVGDVANGINEVPCEFCPALIRFEIVGGHPSIPYVKAAETQV